MQLSQHAANGIANAQQEEDGWQSMLNLAVDAETEPENPYLGEENPESIVPENDLPFWRTRVTAADDEEDEEGTVRTGALLTGL